MWVPRQLFDVLVAQLTEHRATFERTLAVTREENTTLRRLLESSHARAESLSLELTKALAIGGLGPQATLASRREPRPPTSRDPVRGLGNMFAPVPFSDPEGTFQTEADAALLFPSTNGDASLEEATA